MDNIGPSAPFRTPQRGRSGYPAHLARAGEGPRVPLHRRGTSQKYECLEDLLREAGFKETRIFTPEAERTEAAAETRRRQAQKIREVNRSGANGNSGFGLFGFLSGLVSRNDKEASGRKIESQHAKTQSLGRLTGKQTQIVLNDDCERPKTAEGVSDILVTPMPIRRKPFTPIILTSDLSSPGSSSSASSRSPPPLQSRSSRFAGHVQKNGLPDHTRLDARTTLRHMMSLPEFAPGQQSSRRNFLLRATEKPHVATTSRSSRMHHSGARSRFNTNNEIPPPLPPNFLAAISQAITRTSSPGTNVARPRPSPQSREYVDSYSIYKSTTLTKYECRERSLARRGFTPRTPGVDATPGVVTPASVVCRSAPGSRSSSVIRGPSVGARTRRRRQKGALDACMPCLGVTSVQLPGSPSSGIRNDCYGAYSHDELVRASADDVYDDDSSDDGELDFGRLILPARRQHSIQSLRRHLHNHAVASAASGGGNAPPSAFKNRVPRRTDSQFSVGARNKTRSRAEVLDDPDDLLHSRCVSSDEDAEDGLLADWAAHGLPGLQSAVRKKRGGLPWTSRIQGN